jgi:hypothetical protein
VLVLLHCNLWRYSEIIYILFAWVIGYTSQRVIGYQITLGYLNTVWVNVVLVVENICELDGMLSNKSLKAFLVLLKDS